MLQKISNFFEVSQATRNRTTDQLIINLRAMFNSIDIKNLKNEPEKSIAELVKNKLEECQGIKTDTDEQIQNLWDLIFEIEFLLTQIFSGDMLKNEVLRRSDDVKKNVAAADYYKKHANFDNIAALKDKSDGELRALLGRMVSDLQKHYVARYSRGEYARLAARRVSWMFLLSFLIFLIVILTFHFVKEDTESSITDRSQEQSDQKVDESKTGQKKKPVTN